MSLYGFCFQLFFLFQSALQELKCQTVSNQLLVYFISLFGSSAGAGLEEVWFPEHVNNVQYTGE